MGRVVLCLALLGIGCSKGNQSNLKGNQEKPGKPEAVHYGRELKPEELGQEQAPQSNQEQGKKEKGSNASYPPFPSYRNGKIEYKQID